MKADEIRALPDEEIHHRLDEMKEEYFNLRFQNATGQLENYKRIGIVRKDIARLESIAKERELGLTVIPKAETKKRRWRKSKGEEEALEAREEEKEAPAEEPLPETEEE